MAIQSYFYAARLLLCLIASALLLRLLFFQPSTPTDSESSTPLPLVLRVQGDKLDPPQQEPHASYVRYPLSDVPVYIVSNNNVNNSVIHRFFDSSPFSPSGRYIAATLLPSTSRGHAKVLVYDLRSGGGPTTVASTSAWGAQVGAHVQWGADDTQLFYNSIGQERQLIGKLFDLTADSARSGREKELSCPVYHVSSDGRWAATPNQLRIKDTQFGYGADYYLRAPPEAFSSSAHGDGLFVLNVQRNECRLAVSLASFAQAARLSLSSLSSAPLYGFHVKWSRDGSRLLFVMRTLESRKVMFLAPPIRRQHLFVVSFDASSGAVTGKPRHLLSWSSKSPKDALDANHPNWVGNTHKVSINVKPRGSTAPWGLVVIDTSSATLPVDALPLPPLYSPSSGHPNFYPTDSRFVLLDAYEKETLSLGGERTKNDSIPLRLVDTIQKREVWLLQVRLGLASPRPAYLATLPIKERRAWQRCDMHPAWSRTGAWVAFNARPNGVVRQLMIAYIGDSPGSLFPLAASSV